MKDRLKPEVYTLENGLTVYYFPSDAPYVTARYVVPFGSGHNTGDIRNGTFHFLEHTVLNRSKQYPEYKAWNTAVGLVGGYSNASTGRRQTAYIVALPIAHKELIDGFFSHIFEPILTEEDVVGERGIIRNERKSKERWFPGSDEISHYIWSEWLSEDKDYIIQRLGSDEDLEAITAEYLNDIHQKHYFSNKGFLMVSGGVSPEFFIEKLKNITTKDAQHPYQARTVVWKDKEYRSMAFTDASRYTYHLGGTTEKDFKKNFIGRFALALLINSVQGPLYTWLRDEKKWTYGLSREIDAGYENTVWIIKIPLSHPEHIPEVRKELLERIRTAFSDEALIAREKERFIGQQTFQFETPDEILDFVSGLYGDYGVFVTETMVRDIITNITSADLLQFLDADIGEILITPKEE